MKRSCEYCGKPTDQGQPWVLLNRVCFGSGQASMMSSFTDDENQCSWDQNKWIASGPVLCYPDCLRDFIEGRMIECDIKTGKT